MSEVDEITSEDLAAAAALYANRQPFAHLRHGN